MKNEIEYYSFEEAMREYRFSDTTQTNDDYFKKATKKHNTQYFNSLNSRFLFCLIYINSSASEGSTFLQSPGILCFCEDSIFFSNKCGLDYDEGRIDYAEVEQFAIKTKLSTGRAIAGYMGFNSSYIGFFLKDKSKIVFYIRNSDAVYALTKISALCKNADFPYTPIHVENDTFYFNRK